MNYIGLVALVACMCGCSAFVGMSGPGDASGGDGAGSCQTGRVRCGSVCTDMNTDDSNCGACGNACAQAQTCFSGACRPRAVGAPCTTAADCGAAGRCLGAYPGGECFYVCQSQADCGAGALCVPSGGTSICVPNCPCRSGYICMSLPGGMGCNVDCRGNEWLCGAYACSSSGICGDRCLNAIGTPYPCGAGSQCSGNGTSYGSCSCTASTDCGPGGICGPSGQCQCLSDEACAAGRTCNVATGECMCSESSCGGSMTCNRSTGSCE